MRSERDVAGESGYLLWISSAANAAGYLAYVMIGHPQLTTGVLLGLVAVGAALASLLVAGTPNPESMRPALMSLPLVLAAEGLVASFIGILSMRILKAFSPAAALRYSTFIAAGLFLAFAYFTIDGQATKIRR